MTSKNIYSWLQPHLLEPNPPISIFRLRCCPCPILWLKSSSQNWPYSHSYLGIETGWLTFGDDGGVWFSLDFSANIPCEWGGELDSGIPLWLQGVTGEGFSSKSTEVDVPVPISMGPTRTSWKMNQGKNVNFIKFRLKPPCYSNHKSPIFLFQLRGEEETV